MRKFIAKHSPLTWLVAVALLAGCKDIGEDNSTSYEVAGGSDISASSQSLLLTELSTLNGVEMVIAQVMDTSGVCYFKQPLACVRSFCAQAGSSQGERKNQNYGVKGRPCCPL